MSALLDRLGEALTVLRAFQRRWRATLFVGFTALFLAGVAYSVWRLEIDPASVDLAWLGILAATIPFSFVYAAFNLRLLAAGAGTSIGFADAWKAANIAQAAEFLPLPGGAMVRGGVLVDRGVPTKAAAAHVLVNALLWVGISAAAAGAAFGGSTPFSFALIAIGSSLTLGCTLWLAGIAGSAIALAAMALRCLGLAIIGLRLVCAFAVLAEPISLVDTLPLSFATILGTASSLAPGGLGISEGLASLMAGVLYLDPTVAFLAVGLNRLFGLMFCGTISLTLLAPAGRRGTNLG